MADKGLLRILRKGSGKWNEWRREHPEVSAPDLSFAVLPNLYLPSVQLQGANLYGADFKDATLIEANFAGANLGNASFEEAKLKSANFQRANLNWALLRGTMFGGTDFSGANLSRATFSHNYFNIKSFRGADLSGAFLNGMTFLDTDLTGANLHGADIRGAYFSRAVLSGTKFDNSTMGDTVFGDVDLRGAEGLSAVEHLGPSDVSLSAIYRSNGAVPRAFLLGCGVPESFITQIPSLLGGVQPVQFYSCFISYSSQDVDFARRLQARMRDAGLRVWFAPEDIKGGEKLYEQINRAIQLHDRLLIVLSENSIKSEWVMTEIRRARRTEVKEGRRKLFPIRLVDYDVVRDWECFDADNGKDLAVEVREYYIPDFSNWKNHDDFEREFYRLYESLKAVS